MLFSNQLNLILAYFTEEEQSYIRDMVDFNALNLSPEDEYILLKIIRTINVDSPQIKKEYIIDIFENIFVRQTPPNFFIANAGEDLMLTIKLGKSQDLTGTILTIREDDGTLLSGDDTMGTSEKSQIVNFIDIDLTPKEFYKLRVLSESPTEGGIATGNVLSVLDTFYIYIDDNVDTL